MISVTPISCFGFAITNFLHFKSKIWYCTTNKCNKVDYFSLSCKNWCCGGVDAWRVHNLKVGGSSLDGGGTSSDLTVENDVCCEEVRVEE